MKQKYEMPELEMARFETADVILASVVDELDDTDNTKPYPWGQA